MADDEVVQAEGESSDASVRVVVRNGRLSAIEADSSLVPARYSAFQRAVIEAVNQALESYETRMLAFVQDHPEAEVLHRIEADAAAARARFDEIVARARDWDGS